MELTIGGVTNLMTMGLSGPAKSVSGLKDLLRISAVSNILINTCQEALEKMSPELREEIGFGRELIDIYSAVNHPEKSFKYLEGICNIIQGGFVTVDHAEKYIEIHNTKAETKNHVQKCYNIR